MLCLASGCVATGADPNFGTSPFQGPATTDDSCSSPGCHGDPIVTSGADPSFDSGASEGSTSGHTGDTSGSGETTTTDDTSPQGTSTAGEEPTTCADHCGAFSEGASCQCDAQCTERGDCCDDHATSCNLRSCEQQCGDYDRDFSCQCDVRCADMGDCCDDYEDHCVGPDGEPVFSCIGRCHTLWDRSQPCQCDSWCTTMGDCCSDFNQVCLP